MTESPAPYNPEPEPSGHGTGHGVDGNKANYYEISLVLNNYLVPGLQKDVRYPKELEGKFKDFDQDKKAEWYSYTYHALIGPALVYVSGSLGRQLNHKECDYITGRIESFLKDAGF